MKRIIVVLLFFVLFAQSQNVFCATNEKNPYVESVKIADELVQSNLTGNYNRPPVNEAKFTDDLVEATLRSNYKKPLANTSMVSDEIAKRTLTANYSKPYTNTDYNYQSIEYVLFKVKIKNKLSSRNAREGQKILFETIEPVKINDKVNFNKGTEILANVEFVSLNEMRGEPAILIIDNFEIKNYPQYKLSGQIYKEGAKRSYWINPMSIVLMPFWGTGLILHFIRGGHAKITPNKVYKLYLWKD